jgi:hypothetical protein
MSEVFNPTEEWVMECFSLPVQKNGTSNVHVSPGLNLFAGARYVLTPHWALFGEFKFNHATVRFSDVRGNYDTQLFVFGLMWHFEK